MTADAPGPQDATPITRARNRAVLDALPFGDRQDFADARRGFIGTLPEVEITNAQGRVVWSLKDYAFLADEDAPPTVNPSLWRQARLNMENGLFHVTEGIYQIRGFDLSNMTLIEGERGVIVIDPLISTEVARAGLELYFEHRGRRTVTAVIYSHSHTDHYGGVRGVLDEAAVQAGTAVVIAPDRFMEEVVSESVLAGTAMVRRAMFQFGPTIPKGPRGQVDAGLGKVTSRGTVTLIPPTLTIREPIEVHRIDGVEIVFHLAPETEAPAEMHMFYPGLRALNLAENATHNLHNVYPIRGAQVRDANAWAKYLNEAIDRFARQADVVFAQHHWPTWGPGATARFPRQAARPLQVPARPDRPPHEPRRDGCRHRRAAHPAGRPPLDVARARLLRHAQPQREGGVPALHRLVRRQPGQPESPPAGGAGPEVRGVHGRCRGGPPASAGRLRQG
jgi:alkyl sulfatase BDS1-like metallo-beta-lactamase superfamily hydrolase